MTSGTIIARYALLELTPGEALGLYRLAVQLGAARDADNVPVETWKLYARIALWLPASPAPAPRPRTR